MSDSKPETHQNVYLQNVVTGATPNPVIQNPDAIDEEFIATANRVLSNAAELIRVLIGAHQSAIAIDELAQKRSQSGEIARSRSIPSKESCQKYNAL